MYHQYKNPPKNGGSLFQIKNYFLRFAAFFLLAGRLAAFFFLAAGRFAFFAAFFFLAIMSVTPFRRNDRASNLASCFKNHS